MLKRNIDDAMAVIFTNSYDELATEMVAERSLASIPFAGRYRMCDFLISSFVHSGISSISLMCKKNYHSLMDHLGSGQEFDLARKNGGLNIVPPFAEKQMQVYHGRVEALNSLRGYLRKCEEKYVILADSNYALNYDFRELIKAHAKNGADVTYLYRRESVPKAFFRPTNSKEIYYTLELDGDVVTDIKINSHKMGVVNFSMNCSIVERTRLLELIEEASNNGCSFFSRDVIKPHLSTLNVRAVEYKGYAAHITDIRSYFDESMALLNEDNCNALFKGNSVYTKVRDDNPTRYLPGAVAQNVMVADGCVIEGEVKNSIIFRGVKIAKGAKVSNCILMQDTIVEEGAEIEYIITDKDVMITKDKILTGNSSYQVYVSKGQIV